MTTTQYPTHAVFIERALNRTPGTVLDAFFAELRLQAKYGIPRAGAHWLLHQAPYRPSEARGCDVEVPQRDSGISVLRAVTAWDADRIDTAALTFVSECRQETKTLWSHPRVKGRFKLRPVEAAGS